MNAPFDPRQQPIGSAQPRGVYAARRTQGKSFWGAACGCFAAALVLGAAALVVGFVLLRPRLLDVAVQVAGLQQQGEIAQVFAPPPQPLALPVLADAYRPETVTFQLPDRQESFDTLSVGAQAEIGSTGSGQAAVVTMDEAALLNLCRERSGICRNEDPRLQNVRVDLRPGALVIYGDLQLEQLNAFGLNGQTLGVVLRVDASGRQLAFAGVDIGGLFYAGRPSGIPQLVDLLDQGQARLNEALAAFTMQTGASALALSEIQLGESAASLIFRQ